MALENSETWYLRKHEDAEIFGPVVFSKIQEWANTAQVAPQDMISSDQEVWTKAPMLPDLKMDWIVKMGDDQYYGPTTIGALVEFRKNGEIDADTMILDCCTGEETRLGLSPFYTVGSFPEEADLMNRGPSRGVIRLGLQKRIRELEINLLEKRRHLDQATQTINRLEARVATLEARVKEISGFGGQR
jgi:hypothetical protein